VSNSKRREPERREGAAPERLPFVQSDEWESRNTISRGGGIRVTQDIYSDSNCCYCFRKTKPDAQRLSMIRTHDGNWWLIAPAAPIRSDEWDRFWLPVGPDCLRSHPEWQFALTTKWSEGGEPTIHASKQQDKVPTTVQVLRYLRDHGPSGCSDIGTVIENRRGSRGGVSTNGGGDYAAQMLLGRMKRAGLVEHAPSDGSSLWQLTSAGHAKLKETPR
jgi:hypothetical protein